jgi:hypothetical protein
MAKKEIKKEDEKQVRESLTGLEYWEWRTTISELDVAREKLMKTDLEIKLLNKEAEILSIRTQLYKSTKLAAEKEKFTSAQKEYERFKKQLEESLGRSLSNTVIEDHTFLIRDLPDENTP